MKVKFQIFRGMFSSLETLFTQAAEFASEIGKDKIISISHSQEVITVWYWSEE
jgi:hypothetical protein